ncbi:hypothetical protein P8V03_18950, partial [Clostridium sp. A1-XYC3]|nr:hypothetical protein [Clostridium sp. A1-XYC3]
YCKNNPVNNTDPSGYSLISILSKINQYVFAVALVIVAVVNYNISGQNKSISNTINNAISNYKARNKAVSKSKSKVKDIATTNTKNQNPTYLRAKATHPGANVYVDQPLNLQSAKMILDIGGDVYAHSAVDAEILSKSVGGGFTGPTNDGNPLNAMHYHPISYAARGHVFYGDDPNLNFVTLFK